eukprot:2029488-Rhodomonas_salina.3
MFDTYGEPAQVQIPGITRSSVRGLPSGTDAVVLVGAVRDRVPVPVRGERLAASETQNAKPAHWCSHHP